MRDQILDFSEDGASLRVRLENLEILRGGESVAMIPLGDIAAVVLSNPAVVMTQAVLGGLASNGACVVVSDRSRNPSGLLVPIVGHSTQSERMRAQANASAPTQKRLWKEIVKCKLEAQGKLLKHAVGDDAGLLALARSVRSGDPDNREAQGARKYWERIFGDTGFRRDREAANCNELLNYGYTVLRAMVARAICASGLHPSLGVHHKNRYSSFPLADDIMEPFRTLVDRAVVDVVSTHGIAVRLSKEVKVPILRSLAGRVDMGAESRSVFDVLSRVTASLASVYEGGRDVMVLPSFDFAQSGPGSEIGS